MNIGDRIPDVLGTDQNGKVLKAEDFKGKKLVLYAYPKDNTSGCTAEACSLRDSSAALAAAGYQIVGVSKDSEASHQKFAAKYDLDFPLIADTSTELLQALGAWGEKNMYGRKTMGTLRTTYLVDENGIVTHIFTPKQIKTAEHGAQILAAISQQDS